MNLNSIIIFRFYFSTIFFSFRLLSNRLIKYLIAQLSDSDSISVVYLLTQQWYSNIQQDISNLWDLISNVYFSKLYLHKIKLSDFYVNNAWNALIPWGHWEKKLVTVLLLILDIAKYINSEAAASYNSIADKTYGYFLTILAVTHKKVKMFLESNSIF